MRMLQLAQKQISKTKAKREAALIASDLRSGVERLGDMIAEAKRIVPFTGAGISRSRSTSSSPARRRATNLGAGASP
ncbi:thiamine pyrophosphate-dependent acetolactate synthase large subunit-like protein [Bradyrhizobium sp. GM5.1]